MLGTLPETVFNPKNPAPLEALCQMAASCTRCALSRARTQAVFSDGSPQAQIMLIGEGPGQQEDETGVPFVGKAGQLLTQILASIGIDRKRDIYICNTVKCRPPGNRKPEAEEMAACWPYLEGQIHWVKPRIILLSGATAVEDVLKTKVGITKLRGQWFDTPFNGAIAMPIFHPSYLLRNQSKAPNSPKWHTWQDMKTLRQKLDDLGIPVSGELHPLALQ